LGNHVDQIRVGPPARGAASEILLTALIFIGVSAASMLAGLALSAIALALFRSTDEGVLFLQLFIFNCITLLINPVLFATIAANHCRRVPAYFVPVTVIPWLRQISRLDHSEMIATGISAVAGIALAYWVLKRKARSFELRSSHVAVQR
jgi:hypothetical protein